MEVTEQTCHKPHLKIVDSVCWLNLHICMSIHMAEHASNSACQAKTGTLCSSFVVLLFRLCVFSLELYSVCDSAVWTFGVCLNFILLVFVWVLSEQNSAVELVNTVNVWQVVRLLRYTCVYVANVFFCMRMNTDKDTKHFYSRCVCFHGGFTVCVIMQFELLVFAWILSEQMQC